MAKAVGVSQPTVQRWIKGKAIPDAEQISKLADLFKLSADELLGRSVRENTKLNIETSDQPNTILIDEALAEVQTIKETVAALERKLKKLKP